MTKIERRSLLAALVAAGFASRADAQIGGIAVGSGRGRASGIRLNGNKVETRTPDDSRPAPTIIGVLFPPEVEPTAPEFSGALWVYCSGTTGTVTVTLKVNILGTPLPLASATWELA